MEYPKDRSWVIFTARSEAKWINFTAEDVMFSYKFPRKGLPYLAVIEKEIDTVEILGKHKIKFTFKKGSNKRFTCICWFPPNFFKTTMKNQEQT